jgi:hypothetical protein
MCLTLSELAETTETQHKGAPLVHTGIPEGPARLAAVSYEWENEYRRGGSDDEPATGVHKLRGGRGGKPRARRAPLVSAFVAQTTAMAAAMTVKIEMNFMIYKSSRKRDKGGH